MHHDYLQLEVFARTAGCSNPLGVELDAAGRLAADHPIPGAAPKC